MTLRAIHHTGLVVTDLDRSIWFYHDVLELIVYANRPASSTAPVANHPAEQHLRSRPSLAEIQAGTRPDAPAVHA